MIDNRSTISPPLHLWLGVHDGDVYMRYTVLYMQVLGNVNNITQFYIHENNGWFMVW